MPAQGPALGENCIGYVCADVVVDVVVGIDRVNVLGFFFSCVRVLLLSPLPSLYTNQKIASCCCSRKQFDSKGCAAVISQKFDLTVRSGTHISLCHHCPKGTSTIGRKEKKHVCK